eukprot:2771577-Amphidinium_carterae.1
MFSNVLYTNVLGSRNTIGCLRLGVFEASRLASEPVVLVSCWSCVEVCKSIPAQPPIKTWRNTRMKQVGGNGHGQQGCKDEAWDRILL